MNRPFRPARVLASALAAGALLATAACSDEGASADASPAPRLTQAGANAALITEADIEDYWQQADDAATWRDKLLVGRVDVAGFTIRKNNAADCQRFVDSLYAHNLLGRPSGVSALTGFTEEDSRLWYQVGDYGEARMRAAMAWLETIPGKCDQFTMTGSGGDKRIVRIIETTLPNAGDDRQGMRVTVQGSPDGQPATLNLDVATVRVGGSGIALTNGGLTDADHITTDHAVQQGGQRLQTVLSGKTPPPAPGTFD